MKTPYFQKSLRLTLAILAVIAQGTARGTGYADAVLAREPVTYWRLNETTALPSADLAVNHGTLGAEADGYYCGGAVHPVAGALTGRTNTAAAFVARKGSLVSVPMTPGLMMQAPFTVECWARPATTRPDDSGPMCPLGCLGRPLDGKNRSGGWLFYQVRNAWYFCIGNPVDYQIFKGTTKPLAGDWYHLAATFDGVRVCLYVNGKEEAAGTLTLEYEANLRYPLGIGARGDSDGIRYEGAVDEVAVYPSVLTAGEIAAHYENGTNALPRIPYAELVLAQKPLGYWRLDESSRVPPTGLPVATNLGSLGASADGLYQPGLQSGVPGPRPPAWEGFEEGNQAVELNGVAGCIRTLYQLNGLNQFTITGWIQRGPPGAESAIYFSQTHVVQVGDYGDTIRVELLLNSDTNALPGVDFSVPYPYPQGEWGMLAIVGDGSRVAVYTNGMLAGSSARSVTDYGRSESTFQIGCGGLYQSGIDHFRGSIDEVAVFERALTQEEILGIYQAADLVRLTIRPLDSQLEIRWARGVLEESPTIPGTWVSVSGASPPVYLAPLSAAGSRFYRVVGP